MLTSVSSCAPCSTVLALFYPPSPPPPTSTLQDTEVTGPRLRASGAPSGGNFVGSCYFVGSCHRSTIRKDEGGGANRGTCAAAATKSYVFVFFFIFVSTNLPFYLLQQVQEHNETGRMPPVLWPRSIKGNRNGWTQGGLGGWRMKET